MRLPSPAAGASPLTERLVGPRPRSTPGWEAGRAGLGSPPCPRPTAHLGPGAWAPAGWPRLAQRQVTFPQRGPAAWSLTREVTGRKRRSCQTSGTKAFSGHKRVRAALRRVPGQSTASNCQGPRPAAGEGALLCLPKAPLAGVASRAAHPPREAGLEAATREEGTGLSACRGPVLFRTHGSRFNSFNRQPHTEGRTESIFSRHKLFLKD